MSELSCQKCGLPKDICTCAEEDATKILIDTQEKKRFEAVLDHIKKSGKVQFSQLKTGDILISGEKGIILIERKSVGDFAGSLSSGQLFKELKQMFEETKEIVSKMKTDIIEILASLGHEQWMNWTQDTVVNLEDLHDRERYEIWKRSWIPYSELSEELKEKDRVWARKVVETLAGVPFFQTFVVVEGSILQILRRDWQIKSLLSGLAMIPLSWKINLIWLENKEITPLLIEAFSDYVGKAKEPPKIYGTRPKRKFKSIKEQQRFLIEGFAGVGGETAEKLLSGCGSPAEIFDLLEKGIKIPGLGPKRADLMKKILFTKYRK